MATYSRQLLSASVDGELVAVAAIATPGTLVHTALAGTSGFDEVYLWATNIDSQPHQVTIEWGAAGAANHLVDTFTLPAHSPPVPLITGQVLRNAKTVAVFADAANVVNVSGYVNRIL
jgi:hypothetical protein